MFQRSSRAIVVLVTVFSAVFGSPTEADPLVPPPIRPSIDENGIDLVSGKITSARTDLVIGQPGAGGLAFGGMLTSMLMYSRAVDTTWYLGAVTSVTGPTTTLYTVTLGGYAESFGKANSPSNSPFVSIQGLGSTLTQNSTTYTYTAPDGSVAVFSKTITTVVAGDVGGAITTYTSPDGEIRTYTYVSVSSVNRLQSVTNNRGYQIKLIYAADGNISSAMGINMAVDYCAPTANACTGLTQSWPTVNYNRTNSGAPSFTDTYTITDQLGNATTYTHITNPDQPLSIRWAGSQSDDVIYTFKPSTFSIVASVNRHGRTWSYAYTSTSSELTTVVTDPLNHQSTYIFDATTRSIKSYTNAAGEVTTYQNDSNGRPTLITLPTAADGTTNEKLNYAYDARGNVTEIHRWSSPAGSELVTRAGYDATCTTSTSKKCNKPNWTKDAAGNQTDYVYNTSHGNPTLITLPAQPNGIRPATSFTYTAYQAYYKNSAGSIVGAGTNVYYLTSVAQCRTTSGCAATSADQMRTDIGYGANSVANNRLPVQTTVRNGSGSLIATTTLQYDNVGNLTSSDGPLSGTTDKSVTQYDALRRVTGTIGPDPDDAGPRLNIAARTMYDPRGLPTVVETGTLPNQTDSVWGTSFTLAQSVVREYDADQRLKKTSLAAGGTTYSVQQLSFDPLGRLDCRATRMNTTSFGGTLPDACTVTSVGSFGGDRILKYSYDNADRVLSVVSGFGWPDAITEQTVTYYPGGRLNTLSDGKGNTTTYSYDMFGRLFQVHYPDPANVGSSSASDYEEYGYDVNSRVVTTRKRNGTVIGTPRDGLGRITVRDLPSTPEDVYFFYDNQGRALKALFNDSLGSGANGVIQTYDGLGRLATRSVFGRQLGYGYDLRGRRTQLTHPDGFAVTYGYSNIDELLTVTDSTGATVATYGYDALGNRTGVTRPNGTSTSYVPDALGRLQQLTQDLSGSTFDLTETFTYNPAGQIATKTSSNDATYTPSLPASTTSGQFDGQNQITNFGSVSIVDDANANIWTGLGSLAYTHDVLGQLRGASGGVTVDYDPAGMLSRVTVGSTKTDYLYDGADLVAEYAHVDSPVNITPLRRFVHGAGADEPLATYEGSGTTSKTWLHADEHGSIVAASNSSGVAAASVKYTADGDSGTLVSPFGYTGQMYLAELQLYYYKARMYSAKAGRFLQPDPIRHEGGMNLYAYAANDPVNMRDPSGLEVIGDYTFIYPSCSGTCWRPADARYWFPYDRPSGQSWYGPSGYVADTTPKPQQSPDCNEEQGEGGGGGSAHALANGGAAGSFLLDSKATAAEQALSASLRAGRPYASTQGVLDPALFPGTIQKPSVYTWRASQAVSGTALYVGAKFLGATATAVDFYEGAHDALEGDAVGATSNLGSAAAGGAMLYSFAAAPVALPALLQLKMLPGYVKTVAESLCRGQAASSFFFID